LDFRSLTAIDGKPQGLFIPNFFLMLYSFIVLASHGRNDGHDESLTTATAAAAASTATVAAGSSSVGSRRDASRAAGKLCFFLLPSFTTLMFSFSVTTMTAMRQQQPQLQHQQLQQQP
jgi:hypothetical protein